MDWRLVAIALPWSLVEFIRDQFAMVLPQADQASPFGEILPQQSVEVFITATLPIRKSRTVTDSVDIVSYGPRFAGQFNHLWVGWLRETTGQEPQREDLDAVDHPEEFYIAQGGATFFAVRGIDSVPVGVVAVKNLGDGDYEFCKLVVSEQARGSGSGRALVERCIAFARERAGRNLYLQSFHALQTAIQMYHRMGFVACCAPESMSVLGRTQLIMKLSIPSTTPA